MIPSPPLGPPFSLVALDVVDSTNDEARRLAQRGFGHGTAVWAEEQTAGRGRRGREWVSPRGNLHLSLIIDPDRPLREAAQLGFVAAVALCDALAALAPQARFECKWPNDVWCNGRKIAGMLLEGAGVDDLLILGIGVDVVAAPDPALYPATSLRDVGCEAEAAAVLTGFCNRLLPLLAVWRDDGFGPIRDAWLQRARGVGEPVEVRLEGETLIGVFAGLGEDGGLRLDLPDGTSRRVLAGDVFFPGS